MSGLSRRRLRYVSAAAAVVFLLSGCTWRIGSPSSHEAWSSGADIALGAALSSLGTAELVLEQQDQGHLPNRYVKVALRDTMRTLDVEAARFRAAQPPDDMLEANGDVTAALEMSVVALNQAATAGSSADVAGRRAARRVVAAAYRHVDALQRRLTARYGG